MHPTQGQKKYFDYINANFIDGYQKSRAFIGTQGPLPDTFDCFWRMIWEQRVVIIVMITNLVERGRRKCDMYWPKEGMETYGIIQVKLIEEEVMSAYTVRTFHLKHLKVSCYLFFFYNFQLTICFRGFDVSVSPCVRDYVRISELFVFSFRCGLFCFGGMECGIS